MSEQYGDAWIHAQIHLHKKTGEMHSDGNHDVRKIIAKKIQDLEAKLAEAVEMHDYLSQHFYLPQEAYYRFSEFKESLEKHKASN